MSVGTPAEAAGTERPLGTGMLAEAAGAGALGEPESALVTFGSVLALVTWEVPAARVPNLGGSDSGAGSWVLCDRGGAGVEGRNGGRGVVPNPSPLGQRVCRKPIEVRRGLNALPFP